MTTRVQKDQRGFGHIGIIFAIVVILAAGGVGWWVWQKNKDSGTATKAQQDAVKNAKCDYDDKDLCKFFASWKATEYYTITGTTTINDKTETTTVETQGTDRTHIIFSGTANYETITIGNDYYTKAGDIWYKQSLATSTQLNVTGGDTSFVAPDSDSESAPTYTKVGTEKCGDFTCFKYKVEDPLAPDATQFIWFDNKDYQLRRMQFSTTDGTVYDSTFSYDKVAIDAPSPSKDLAADEYIVPGQTEPTKLPSGETPSDAALQDLINQYSN